MDLAAWAERNGFARVSAYRWFRSGALPVPARRVGRLISGIVKSPNVTAGRSERPAEPQLQTGVGCAHVGSVAQQAYGSEQFVQSQRIGMMRIRGAPVVDPGCERDRYGHPRPDDRLEQGPDSGIAIASTNGGMYISAIALRDVATGKLG